MPEVPVRDAATLGAQIRRGLAFGVPFVGVSALGFAAQKGYDGGVFKDIWEQAKLASPLAAMLALYTWQAERRERINAQQQCADRTVDFIKTTNAGYRAMDKLASVVEKKSRSRA